MICEGSKNEAFTNRAECFSLSRLRIFEALNAREMLLLVFVDRSGLNSVLKVLACGIEIMQTVQRKGALSTIGSLVSDVIPAASTMESAFHKTYPIDFFSHEAQAALT